VLDAVAQRLRAMMQPASSNASAVTWTTSPFAFSV
jgi:hypothetical protein